MKWWCGACGCELPLLQGMVNMAPCHCGTTNGQNFEPKPGTVTKSKACPPSVDPSLSGIFKN
jgi:hypothetical protein